jgi:hypothetical protein
MQDYYETPESVEARAIMRLVSLGTTTLDDARDLISVPEKESHALHLFVAISGKDAASIGHALAFRRKVSVEFEKLARLMQMDAPVVLESK